MTVGSVGATTCVEQATVVPPEFGVMVKSGIFNVIVCVTVADTGCGMSVEDVENLFRADKRINAAPESKEQGYGTGFGLILCRYIIKKHDDETRRGCKIWVESEVNKGTKIHFILCATT